MISSTWKFMARSVVNHMSRAKAHDVLERLNEHINKPVVLDELVEEVTQQSFMKNVESLLYGRETSRYENPDEDNFQTSSKASVFIDMDLYGRYRDEQTYKALKSYQCEYLQKLLEARVKHLDELADLMYRVPDLSPLEVILGRPI